MDNGPAVSFFPAVSPDGLTVTMAGSVVKLERVSIGPMDSA